MTVPVSPSGLGPKFRVAICGAGIGGLVLAITIGNYGSSIPIDLYEAHDSIETAGVGINMWRRTNDIFVDLGLFDELMQISTYGPERVQGPVMRRSDIREGGYFWFQTVHRHGPFPLGRQQMVAILVKHLPASCTIHLGKQLASYVEPKQEDARSMIPIKLNFADGSAAITDVLIGADGIRSVVRKTMFEAASKDAGNDATDLQQYIGATFTGMTVYRALVPTERLRKEDSEHISLKEMTGHVGKGGFFATYPIANGTMINISATVCNPSLAGTRYEGRWVSDGTLDEFVGYFDSFEPHVRRLIKLCDKPSKWAIHVVKPLPFWSRKRVTLIGDACHAMTPHCGAGAGQAIEDAYLVGRLIAHRLTSLSRIPDALRIYQETRLPFAHSIASRSLSVGWMNAFMEPGYYDGARIGDDVDDSGIGSYEREGMENMKQEILRGWDILDDPQSALQTWEDAESKLKGLTTA